jgi:hypothetical protein
MLRCASVRLPEPRGPASKLSRPTGHPPIPVSASSSGIPVGRAGQGGIAGRGAALPKRVWSTVIAC